VKRGRGRPPGSKNKPKPIEPEPVRTASNSWEFMPGFKDGEAEEIGDDDDTGSWARRLVTDKDGVFRKAIEDSLRTGRISTRAFSWLIDRATVVGKRKADRPLMDFATPVERWILLNISRRAKGEPEIGFRIPGTIRDVTLSEMCTLIASMPELSMAERRRGK
jgi:hypothetical protein